MHDLALARDFSDEIVFMRNGRIAARGNARALLTPDVIADTYDIPRERAGRLGIA